MSFPVRPIVDVAPERHRSAAFSFIQPFVLSLRNIQVRKLKLWIIVLFQYRIANQAAMETGIAVLPGVF